MKNKKVLITGAGGFIGSHLTEELVKLGAKVTVLVRYLSSGGIGQLESLPKEILKKVKIVRGDLKNIQSIQRAMKNTDIVFHLGALISIPYSYEDPRDFIETNIIGTLNILQVAKDYGVKKIIITSTSEVYGTAIYSPIDEEHPLQAQSPYSATKISADKIAESFIKTYNLPIVIIRPFNTYGPRQSMRAVIPTIIYQALTKDKIKLGSLIPKRDFTYVKDTVAGYIKIAKSKNTIGKTINIGSGKTVSIGELVEKIGLLLGKKLIVETDKRKIRPKNSEVGLLLCNNTKAKKLINWVPTTSFEKGLKEVINYMEKNLDKYEIERGNI